MSGMNGGSGPVLIDVSHVIYRAYYGSPEPHDQHAVVQLLPMVRHLREQLRPTHGAAVFDPSGQTWRHRVCWDYKAHRPPKPDGLRVFARLVPSVFEAYGWPILCVDGYEADDVLASLVHRHHDAVVVTSDKDLMQLWGRNGCRIWDPKKVLPHAPDDTWRGDWVTWQDVHKRFGVDPRTEDPARVVEVQALMGDASDGIPGARGVGIVTAVRLIQEYGTADAVIAAARAEALPKAVRRYGPALVEHADTVRMSRRLASLEVGLDVTAGPMRAPDEEAIARLVREHVEPLAAGQQGAPE